MSHYASRHCACAKCLLVLKSQKDSSLNFNPELNDQPLLKIMSQTVLSLFSYAFYHSCIHFFILLVLTVYTACISSVVAYVPQEDILYDELTVEENILYSALLFNRRGLVQTLDLYPMVCTLCGVVECGVV